jgi:hypothetical protein
MQANPTTKPTNEITDKDDSIPMSEVITFFENAMEQQLEKDKEEFAKLIWEPVNRYTRSPKHGRGIMCHLCKKTIRIFHFSWYTLVCPNCKEQVPKNQWLVVKKNKAKISIS